jgi:excisionase family DNA binding protein
MHLNKKARVCMTVKAVEQAVLDEGLMSIEAVAEYLALSRGMVYRLVQEGTLPSTHIGRLRRVPKAAVRELARRGLVSKTGARDPDR